ncbi:MAG: hypothetical protein ACMZ7B_00585 [Balneola sp.]
MNKFSITKLEEARRNPSKFGNQLKTGANAISFGGGLAKSVKWLYAINSYHESGNINNAISYITQAFSNRKDTKKNREEVEQFIDAIENYVDEHNRLGNIFLQKSYNIDLPITPVLHLKGWIWLLNMTSEGRRRAYQIKKPEDAYNWESELQYPIIQDYVANHIYGCRTKDVDVGVIDFYSGEHSQNSFSNTEIQDAINELNSVGNLITSVL